MEKALIFGASRGLGRSVALFIKTHIPTLKSVTLSSRKLTTLESVATETETHLFTADLSTPEGQAKALTEISEGHFDLVIYAAGGGPHGEFIQKEWKDHNWALQLGLVAPMMLAHQWLKHAPPSGGKFIIVGSRIAEQAPDPLASSYAASKHGLLGFVSSLQPELEMSSGKVWLFSPGFMDTEMLPRTAKVRHDGSKLMSPDTAAQVLLRWAIKDGPWHRVLN